MTREEIAALMKAEAELHSSDPMYGEPLEIGYGYTVSFHAKNCPYCQWKLNPPLNLIVRVGPVQELPAQARRVETGPIRFAGDWPGTFIRGDNAIWYAMCLERIFNGDTDPIVRENGKALLRLIQSSDARRLEAGGE